MKQDKNLRKIVPDEGTKSDYNYKRYPVLENAPDTNILGAEENPCSQYDHVISRTVIILH